MSINDSSQINALSIKMQRIQQNIDKYKKIVNYLTDLNSNLFNISSKIKNAITGCLNGGFNDKGNPFGNGLMEETLNSVNYNISEINTLISKNTKQINQLESEIIIIKDKIKQEKDRLILSDI